MTNLYSAANLHWVATCQYPEGHKMEVQLCDAVTDTSSRLEHQQKENYRQNTTESFLPTKLDSQFELAGSAKIICYCFIMPSKYTRWWHNLHDDQAIKHPCVRFNVIVKTSFNNNNLLLLAWPNKQTRSGQRQGILGTQYTCKWLNCLLWVPCVKVTLLLF